MIKLIDILFENKILIPRRSPEERAKSYSIELQKRSEVHLNQIQQYINNGSKGDLKLNKIQIKTLPNNLKTIGGTLEIYDSPIESLPDNFKVQDNLILLRIPNLSLPNNLEVGGNLNLYDSNIKLLPKGLKIKGNLTLARLNLESLPNDLEVEGDVILYGMPLGTKDEIKKMSPGIKGNVIIKK